MHKNLMKTKLSAGQCVLGGIARLAHPSTIEAMGYAGLDWVLIDGEHGSMSFETMETMCMYAYAGGITPVVRLHTISSSMIMRALDLGALGVMVPRVRTVADAEVVAAAARYHPEGTRGSGPSRGVRFGALPALEYYKLSNQEVLTILCIEEAEAIENIEGIAAVPGVDILLVAPNDLSQSLGVHGDHKHPKMLDAIAKTAAAARRHRKWLAIGLRTLDKRDLATYVDAGYDAVLVGVDLFHLREAYAAIVAEAATLRARRT